MVRINKITLNKEFNSNIYFLIVILLFHGPPNDNCNKFSLFRAERKYFSNSIPQKNMFDVVPYSHCRKFNASENFHVNNIKSASFCNMTELQDYG